jgi:hypothetical protein
MIEESVFDDQVTFDENLLLRFQAAKVRYEGASLLQMDDPEIEHEYHQAVLALENLEDPFLKDVAREMNAPGKRATEAEQRLLELSLKVKNLYPLISIRVH